MEISASIDPPAKAPGFRKSIKFALIRLFGGSLEEMMFQWRRLSMRVNTWLGRPYTALYGMDRKLEKYLNFEGGTFIEAGANDGIAQSNSYFLENKYGWNGLLVEPVPKYFRMCQSARGVNVVNCGLGPFEKDGEELEILAGGLMSLPVSVDEKLLHGRSVRQHASIGAREFGGIAPELVRTRVRALSNVLDELKITVVDFFSLDVEGFELEVLKGLDMTRHAPRYLLIETEQLEAVTEFLGSRYEMIEALSHHDFLFRRI
ncbi:MAG TPA: FkbM family methyltransferase [Steroidobacteraceae bacterium]